MTDFYTAQTKGVLDGTKPWTPGDAMFLVNRVHSIVGTIDLQANPVLNGDKIIWGRIPTGAIPLFAGFLSSVSLGSSVIDLGTNKTAGAFRTAATFTAVDQMTGVLKASAFGVPTTEELILQSLITTANMPTGAGNKLCVKFEYAVPFAA